MKRLGRHHRPFYRISVMDAQKPRNGRSIEDVGTYDPMVKDKSQRVKLNMERIDYWISVGAKPSEKVAVLIKKVKANKFGEGKAPAPMTPPKAPPEPEPEAEVEESATEESSEENSSEDASAEEATEESTSEDK
jgi:small subunit ribosomal protein S16